MATESLNNPFSDFGSIVFGQRFVGREKALKEITQRVLGGNYGNLAIMGLPRIGKSSLAWQGIMTKKEDLLQRNIVPIFFQSGTCRDVRSFFTQLVLSLHDEMLLSFNDDRYEKFTEPIIRDLPQSDSDSFQLLVPKYFKVVKRLGYRVIYILDEFDSVQKIFDVAAFHLLRDLSYHPDSKLCFVTCSRKTIKEIEAKNDALSNFYGTFKDLRLGMFSNEDMQAYWNRVNSIKADLSDSYIKRVEYFVGRHPYLLDVLNDYCYRNSTFNLEDNTNSAITDLKLQLWNQFESIIDTLKNENIFDQAIQLILGPVYNVTNIEEERLLKYEFLRVVDNEYKLNVLGRLVGAKTTQGSYLCFSDYYTQVLDRNFITNVDYWPLWTDTEKKIRELIKIYIKETFSSDWETEIMIQNGANEKWTDSLWVEQFNRLKDTREKDMRLFPGASSNLIDYTLTRDMYNVFMAKAWDWFGKVFPGQKKDWGAKFTFLAEIRNPMAHNNREFISQEQILKATEYCKEIVRTISEWEAK